MVESCSREFLLSNEYTDKKPMAKEEEAEDNTQYLEFTLPDGVLPSVPHMGCMHDYRFLVRRPVQYG